MPKIATFYDEKMVFNNDGYSPSPGKPRLLVNALDGNQMRRRSFSPVSREMLFQVHCSKYVNGVCNGETSNGHGHTSVSQAKTFRWTCGSMVEAAVHALDCGVAFSPTSGFHHAGYNRGGGFCTFNGLALAARNIVDISGASVTILDCDWHFGDGTDDIIKRLGDKRITQFCVSDMTESDYLSHLEQVLHEIKSSTCGLVLYQAGADAHVNDPLGGCLTDEGMKTRDAMVFEFCYVNGIPIAWNLAGGYQKDANGSPSKVIELHLNTFNECYKVYG